MKLDLDSSHNTSESVDLTNLYSMDYGCEIRLIYKMKVVVTMRDLQSIERTSLKSCHV